MDPIFHDSDDAMEKNLSTYPLIVKVYKQRYDKMATPQYKQELVRYAEQVLHDPIVHLDWRQLLRWEHKHFEYTKEELPKQRAEMPIDVLVQKKGRCGEFALLYNGLLLANGYRSRIVLDCSALKDKSKNAAGDHVWVEILVKDIWIHVDPTERKINRPDMYAHAWNKDVNLVYAVSEKIEVTKAYRV